MFRSALKVFRKNIWDVFAITGFITIGILFGLLITMPVINNEIDISVSKIVAHATAIPYSGFDPASFLKSITDQFKNLDLRNPMRTIAVLIEQNGLYRIFMNALEDANFNKEVLIEMKDTVIACSDSLIKVIRQQIVNLSICVLISSILALVSSRVIIQIRSTSKKSVGRFFASFFSNLATVSLAYFLIILSLINLDGALLVFSIIGILMVMLVLILLWSVLIYKDKDVKLIELFNIKNILFLWASSLAVLATSALIFLIVYLINNVTGFVILLPLIIISNIINENIVIDYVNQYKKKRVVQSPGHPTQLKNNGNNRIQTKRVVQSPGHPTQTRNKTNNQYNNKRVVQNHGQPTQMKKERSN